MKCKNLSMVLALLLLASTVTACGNAVENETTATTTPETQRETTAQEARMAIPDDLPDEKFDGATFCVLTRDRDDFVNDIGVELELTGDVVDDAIYERNQRIMERFDVKLLAEYAENNGSATHATAQAAVLAGDSSYDVVENQVTQMALVCIWIGIPSCPMWI